MRRRDFIRLFAGTAAWPLAAPAQQSKVSRIGVLTLTEAHEKSFADELRAGLRELGNIEGQNFVLELRSAGGDANRLSKLTAELVRRKVDVIAAVFTPCAKAAKQATATIPIVMISADPIGTGLVASLARPGGNVTGLSNMAPETAGKIVGLFRDMLPSLRRVAVLANPANPFTKSMLQQIEFAGRSAKIEIAPVAMVEGLDAIEAAFAAMARQRADAVVVQSIYFARAVADLAVKYRLPSGAVLRSFVAAGGLMSYGAHVPHLFRRSAAFVHKIVQGAKPADLPVEQATKFELVINLKTAKAIGLAIPESFLLRADKVIE